MACFLPFWNRASDLHSSRTLSMCHCHVLFLLPHRTRQCPKWSTSEPKSHPAVCSSHFAQRARPQHSRPRAQTIENAKGQATKSRDYHGFSPGVSDVSPTGPGTATPRSPRLGQEESLSISSATHHTTVDKKKNTQPLPPLVHRQQLMSLSSKRGCLISFIDDTDPTQNLHHRPARPKPPFPPVIHGPLTNCR